VRRLTIEGAGSVLRDATVELLYKGIEGRDCGTGSRASWRGRAEKLEVRRKAGEEEKLEDQDEEEENGRDKSGGGGGAELAVEALVSAATVEFA